MYDTNEHQPRIVRTSRGLTIEGTRLTLYSVMDYLNMGWPPKLICDRLNLTDQQLAAALDYIAKHRKEVDAEYQQVLLDAETARLYWEARAQERQAMIAALPLRPELAAVHGKLAEARAQYQTK